MTTAGAPAISVVIPTLNRAELLAGTLESLDGQTTAPDHEIVVVDHGSTNPTSKVCLPRVRTGRLRYRRIARVGSALAKNAGLLAARAPLVLFLEDDVAAPDLLEQHVHSHEVHPEEPVAVQGSTTWAPRLAVTPVEEHPIAFAHGLLPERSGDGAEPAFRGLRGGQWSCKRQFLLDHGVFDPAFTSTLEEVELACRLATHGFRVVDNPRAVTYMAAGVRLADFCAGADRRCRALALLARLHDDPDVAHCGRLREPPAFNGREVSLAQQWIARARQLEARIAGDPAAPESVHREFRELCRKILGRLEASAIAHELDPSELPTPLHQPRPKLS